MEVGENIGSGGVGPPQGIGKIGTEEVDFPGTGRLGKGNGRVGNIAS